MATSAGTLELLARELAEALKPLEQRLAAGSVDQLFAELGVRLPASLTAETQLAGTIALGAGAAAALPPLIVQLTAAIDADDTSQIIATGVQLISKLGDVIQALDQIASDLNAAGTTLGGLSPQDRADIAAFSNVLPRRLVDFLLVKYLESKAPNVMLGLTLLGLLDRTPEPGDAANPLKPPFVRRIVHFERISQLVSDPAQYLADTYGWGMPGFDGLAFFQNVSRFLDVLNFPFDLITAPGQPTIFEAYLFAFRVNPAATPPGLVANLRFPATQDFEQLYPLSPPWGLTVSAKARFVADIEAILTPPMDVSLRPPREEVNIDATAGLKGEDTVNPFMLLGQAGGTRLEATTITAVAGFSANWDSAEGRARGEPLLRTEVKGGKLVVDMSQSDGFIQSILAGIQINSAFEFNARWRPSTGIEFEGGADIELVVPVHLKLGPVEIRTLYFRLGFTVEEPIRIEATLAIAASIGPLAVSVARIGAAGIFKFPADGKGNLGPVDLGFAFKPPAGLGLSIDGGGFKGGGFLDFEPEEERYSGMLELEYQDQFTLKAFGLLTTRLPNGQSGFSLLIVISSEFTPIQLGFGFKLNGVGGLLGLNRTVLTEPLRTGLRDNTLSSILFPTDIIANADRILSDLRQVFPPQAGRFMFGPMAKITWGTPVLLSVDLGLIIEIPEPVRLVILGVVRGILPDEQASILRLQVNFLGEINFEQQQLSFDATLFDSKLLAFTLTGDMALRLYWGAEANFLLTVGGFHPAYQPPPMNLPSIRRLTLALLQGDNPRLRLDMYFAVTSNTVQFGARLELYAASWKFNVYGFLSFDVLFQFNPFYFVADITAMLALRVGTSSIASIELALTLEGPTPWRAKGTAKFRICWFFTLKIRFNKTFGEARNTTLPDLAVLPLLLAALSAPDNWEGELPARKHRLESLKAIQVQTGQILVHPLGTLEVSQKVVPLNLRIDRMGSQRPSDTREFQIRDVTPGANPVPAQEAFAPAQFFDMNDEEKLASPSFKNFDSGVRIGEPERLHTAYAAARVVEYELKYIDSQRDRRLEPQQGLFEIDPVAFNTWTLQGAIAKSELAFARKRKSSLAPEAVAVEQESFAIVNTGDLRLFDETSLLGSERAALTRVNALIATNPALRGSLQVVPAFEANP